MEFSEVQLRDIDQLKKQLSALAEDAIEEQVSIRTTLADAYIAMGDAANALPHLNFVAQHLDTLDQSGNETVALLSKLGVAQLNNDEKEVALATFKQALDKAKSFGLVDEYGSLYHRLGNVFMAMEQQAEAAEMYQQAIDWHEEQELFATSVYYNFGLLYVQKKEWTAAIECFDAVLEDYEEDEHSTVDLSQVYQIMGVCYVEERMWKQALLSFHYLSEIQQEEEETVELGKTYLNISRILTQISKHVKSAEYFEMALPLVTPTLSIEQRSELHFELGNNYRDYQENWENALKHYEIAYDLAKQDEDDELRQMFFDKLEDSIEQTKVALEKKNQKKKKKGGFFKRLFG